MKQLSLDVDVFQPREVREIIAEVRYSYTRRYQKFNDDDGTLFFNPMVSSTETSTREYQLGLVLSTEEMQDIRKNAEKILEGVRAFARNEYKNKDDFTILSVDIKYKNRAVFSLDYLLNIKY
jgi:hypothetical protein